MLHKTQKRVVNGASIKSYQDFLGRSGQQIAFCPSKQEISREMSNHAKPVPASGAGRSAK